MLFVAAPALAEGGHASSRGEFTSQGGGPASGGSPRGAEYQRNPTVSKLLDAKAVDGIAKAGPEAAKAIADSSSKFMQQVNQLTSEPIDAGKDVINQLAGAIPDTLSSGATSDSFSQLAKAQQDLAATTTQLYQVQAQGALQLPSPPPTEAPAGVTLAERMARAQSARIPLGRNPTLMQNSATGPASSGSALSRLPAAYNAPR